MPIRSQDARQEDPQSRANEKLWARQNLVNGYATRILRPVEVVLLARYRDELSGRVIELGCGAGRLTGYLIELASAVHGIDISPTMVAYCRQRYPQATIDEGDIREVGALDLGQFDVVVAPFNVIDVVSDVERGIVLDGIRQTLHPGGLLIMSSHNRASASRLGIRHTLAERSAVGQARSIVALPKWVINRRRLLPFERNELDYAILNDVSEDYSALHYYITRDVQERQLAEHGFDLVACLDLDGRPVPGGAPAPHSAELHYVARASSRGSGAA